jgi:choline dehydrogenase-like flavoprotein
VTRLVPGSNGRIVAAELRDLDKNAHTVSAPAYIVACGGVESARLLLSSRSERFPNGMGNRHDLVGRFFTEPPNIEFQAKIERSSSALPSASESERSHQFYEAFKRKGLGSIILTMSYSAPEAQLKLGTTVEMLSPAGNRIKLAITCQTLLWQPGAQGGVKLF